MESVFKTVKLNRKEAQCVASHLKVSPSKVKDSDREELLWEITKKCTKGVSKEGLIEIANMYQIELTSDSIATIKMCIEQALADRGMALAPHSLPSIKEIAETRLKRGSSSKTKAKSEENNHLPKPYAELPEVLKLTTEDAQRRALLLGFKGANSSNRPDCIAYISKKAIQGLEIPELQALCEKAGLSDNMYDTRKTELRYSLLEEASRRGVAILPSVDWDALEKEYQYAELQILKIKDEKAAHSTEKLRLKEEAMQAKEVARQAASIEKDKVRQQEIHDHEQARLIKQQQAQAKKNAKVMGKLVGGLLGGLGSGVGSLFKKSKSQKAHDKWMKRSTNTFNTK